MSGMSETTNSADTQSPRPIQEFREAIFREWVRQFTLKAKGAPRPSTFAAEGGAERETTNSPAEIGTGCTGRKMALVTCILGGCLAYVVGLIAAAWFGCIVGAVSALVAAVLIALVLTSRDMPRRASGGGER